MRPVCLSLILVAALWSAPRAAAAQDGKTISSQDSAQKPKPAPLSLADAVNSVGDEDLAIRDRALQRLEQAGVDDLPALEAMAKNDDVEVRRQVNLTIARIQHADAIRPGELAFQLVYSDGKPIAGANVSLIVYDPHPKPSNVPPPVGGGQAPPCIVFKNFTTDAQGQIDVGSFPGDRYTYSMDVRIKDTALQTSKGTLVLTHASTPVAVALKRGVTVTVTVLDADGQPLPEATVIGVAGMSGWGLEQLEPYRKGPAFQLASLGESGLPRARTDAHGVAVVQTLELNHNHPVAACKDGYEVAISDNLTGPEGGACQTTLKLAKALPTPARFTCSDLARFKKMPGLHVLVFMNHGPSYALQLHTGPYAESEIPQYIKDGAIDVGVTDNQGLIHHDLVPGYYKVVGFAGGENIFSGSVSITPDDPQPNAMLVTAIKAK